MYILFNGQVTQSGAATLGELLDDQHIDRDSVACALNGNFVPRVLYNTTVLSEGSRIEVLSPMQGG